MPGFIISSPELRPGWYGAGPTRKKNLRFGIKPVLLFFSHFPFRLSRANILRLLARGQHFVVPLFFYSDRSWATP